MKKILIAGILSLVIIGCVVAAGCTTATTQQNDSDTQIVGTWFNADETAKFVITDNKTGVYYTMDNGTWKENASLLWTKNSDGTYALVNGNSKATVTLDAVKGQFTTDSGSVYTKKISESSGSISSEKKRIKFNIKPTLTNETISLKGKKLIDEIYPYSLNTPSDGVLEFGYILSKNFKYDADLDSYDPEKRAGITYPTNWTTGNVILGDDAEHGDYVYIWCRIKNNDDYKPCYLGQKYVSQV